MHPPNPHTDHEQGSILLTTLLVMVIMATVSLAVIDKTLFSTRQASHMDTYAQADWYVKGAYEFSKSYLDTHIKNMDESTLGTYLHTPQFINFPIKGGFIRLTIRDGAQCLSLGSLSNGQGQRLFRQLLETLGWSEIQAEQLTASTVDWQDMDSQPTPNGGAEDFTYLGRTPAHRAANTAFISITEMRLLEGISEPDYQKLRTFLCVRPPETVNHINVNNLTLTQAPLLAAFLGGADFLETAQNLITQRPGNGYTAESLRNTPDLIDLDLRNAALNALTFTPEFIWVEARITYLQAVRYSAFEFFISDSELKPVFKSYNDENFRPIIKPHTPDNL